MVLEIYEQLEELKLKPNAAIMNYLLNNLTKNNQSMETVQASFRKARERQAAEVSLTSSVQNKLKEEISRRLVSAKNALRGITSTGSLEGKPVQTMGEEVKKQSDITPLAKEDQAAALNRTAPIESPGPSLIPQPQSQTPTPQSTTLKYTLLDARQEHYQKITANYRRRSFLSLEEQETFISEKVRLLLKEQCEKCGKQLFPKDILKNAVRSDTID